MECNWGQWGKNAGGDKGALDQGAETEPTLKETRGVGARSSLDWNIPWFGI